MTRSTNFSIDDRCYRARRRLSGFISASADKACLETERDFQRLRRKYGLPPVLLYQDKCYRLPKSFCCPECGGPVNVEISEWTARDGIPTIGGVSVWCDEELAEIYNAGDNDRDPNQLHRHWMTDWMPLVVAVERFSMRHIRIPVSS